MKVIKKDGTTENFSREKIKNAVNKPATRVMIKLSDKDIDNLINNVESMAMNMGVDEIPVSDMHNIVEKVLEEFNPTIAKSYKDYRNYKKDFVHLMDEVYTASQSIRFIGDKENANTDSALVATKRCLIFNELNKRLYRKFFMTKDELQACKDGYIYVHDQSARLDTMNCFRRDTRFITKDGIKSFYDFSEGDTTIVMTHKGRWKKAVVHSYGWQPVQKVVFKKGTMTSLPKEVYCTNNHRWILKDGTETTSLSVGDYLYQIKDRTRFDWDSLSAENKKLWCRGFAKGDGSLVGDRGSKFPRYVTVRLCGEKVRYANRFTDCGYTVKEISGGNGDMIVYMNDNCSKDIPFFSLDYNNILYYINGLMCADGDRNKKTASSEFRGIQVTGSLNDYIYDMLNMAGYFVTNIRDLTGTETNYGKRTKTTIHYGLSSSQLNSSCWRVDNIEKATLNPKAKVWCLEVEDDHSFVLEGGIPTGNCCLCDIANVMRGGFEMGNVWYNEPKSLDTAFDVMSDIILSAASQQYGGFSVCEVDKILEPYATKSFKAYMQEYCSITGKTSCKEAEDWAMKKVERDFEQGFQGIEMKLNTVGSSRGDYPFVTMTFGLSTTPFGKMASKTFLRVHANGQGKEGNKKPVLFPKLVFLYDENIHGVGKVNEDVFEEAIKCSSKTMYPKKIGA